MKSLTPVVWKLNFSISENSYGNNKVFRTEKLVKTLELKGYS